jgi:hypothetical protein
MLRSDPSRMPVVEIGAPSTKRRERALKRLRVTLSISYFEAERLLTSSALAHTYGKQCFVHALAMGKYIRKGDNAEDVAEIHRVYLREQLGHRGYTATQVDLAPTELEASLGLWNISATEVQGWLTTHEAAYNQQQAQAKAKRVSADKACGAAGHVCGKACGAPDQTLAKVGNSVFNKPDGGSESSNAGAGESDLTHASNWDKPPAVQKFLAIRQVVCQEAL